MLRKNRPFTLLLEISNATIISGHLNNLFYNLKLCIIAVMLRTVLLEGYLKKYILHLKRKLTFIVTSVLVTVRNP